MGCDSPFVARCVARYYRATIVLTVAAIGLYAGRRTFVHPNFRVMHNLAVALMSSTDAAMAGCYVGLQIGYVNHSACYTVPVARQALF